MAKVTDFFFAQPEEVQTFVLRTYEQESAFLTEQRHVSEHGTDEQKRSMSEALGKISVKNLVQHRYPGVYTDDEISKLWHAALIITR